MASRMERYYKAQPKAKRRVVANQDLYRTIYDMGEYTNIEGIATIDKGNEIDITKIKNMLKNREDYQKQKDLRSLIYKDETKIEEPQLDSDYEDDRIYDISDILLKAKQQKQGPVEKYRNLGDTNYNILKSLKVRDEIDEYVESELEKTTTNTRLLKKLNDSDLSLDLFDELKSNTVSLENTKTAIQQLLKEAKEEERKKYESEKKTELDDSFFTSNMRFNKEDFDDGTQVKVKSKKGIWKKVALVLSLISITVGIVVLVYMLIK